MGKLVCVNCGAEVYFAGKKLKVCPRCKKNPLVKDEEPKRFGSYSKPKKKKHFSDESVIEDVKDEGDVSEKGIDVF